MNLNCIISTIRPNLYKLSESELLEIIREHEPNWICCCDNRSNESVRDKMVSKVNKLWSEYVLKDNNSNPIECLICWSELTNGNNMTFECGHKFHSYCIVKNLLIYSTDTYIDKINDKDIQNFKIEYSCPQCKRIIDSINFEKQS